MDNIDRLIGRFTELTEELLTEGFYKDDISDALRTVNDKLSSGRAKNTVTAIADIDTDRATHKLKKLRKKIKITKKEAQQLADLMELIKSYDVE